MQGWEPDHNRIMGAFALLSGILSILLLLLTKPPAPTQQVLSDFTSNLALYEIALILAVAWSVFSIPFVGELYTMLRVKSSSLAFSAALLSAGGILLLGFATDISLGALFSIATAGTPPNPAEATYQAVFWSKLFYVLSDPGLMALGLGQLLFGWLAWKSKSLPNWLSILGIIGGVAGLLTEAVYQTAILAVIQIAIFAVWGFVTGIILLRTRGPKH